MMIELMGLEVTLRTWKSDPLAPRKELSAFSGDNKVSDAAHQLFSASEIEKMLDFLKAHAPSDYARLFPNQEELDLLLARVRRG